MDKNAEDVSPCERKLGERARVGGLVGKDDMGQRPYIVKEVVDVACEEFPRVVGVAVVDDGLITYLAAKEVDFIRWCG